MNKESHVSALFILRQASANSAEQGLFSEAKDIAIRAVELAKKLYGEESEPHLMCLEEAVEHCMQCKDYAQAEKMQSGLLRLEQLLSGEQSMESKLALRALVEILRIANKNIDPALAS